ncbi:hypothetical protein AB0C93_37875 [Streptomyces sp. NPDC048518]|uniref:hypothetical protein n=1 Tax=Streptomyces sp. NPDC048518 TaxID=3155029 RepID=UPI0033DAF3BE
MMDRIGAPLGVPNQQNLALVVENMVGDDDRRDYEPEPESAGRVFIPRPRPGVAIPRPRPASVIGGPSWR